MNRIFVGECIDMLRQNIADDSVDSIVTDPPYGLSFMGKRWDYKVPTVADWTECLRVLKPGGYLLAFAGTRTQHRMAVNIEDAGFEIRDMIAWVYGSGFPKSHNGDWGGTALKPAMEPITVARKPLVGTVAANWEAHGTGGLNIEGCRITAEDGGRPLREVAPLRDGVAYTGNALSGRVDGSLASSKAVGSTDLGRWPANLIHDGSEEVLAAFPQAPGQLADASSSSSRKTQNAYGAMKRGNSASTQTARNDVGSAARFFYCAKASRADRNEGCEAFTKKPLNWSSGTKNPGSFQSDGTDKSAQNNHPTVKPTDLMRYLCRLVTPPGGVVLDPFMGSGSTGKAAALEGFEFIGIERDADYVEIAKARIDSAMKQMVMVL